MPDQNNEIDHELVASARHMARSDLELSLLVYNRIVLSTGGYPIEPATTVTDALREDLRKARSDLLHAMALETALTDWLNSY